MKNNEFLMDSFSYLSDHLGVFLDVIKHFENETAVIIPSRKISATAVRSTVKKVNEILLVVSKFIEIIY